MSELEREDLEKIVAVLLREHTPNGKAYFRRETLGDAPELHSYTTDVVPGDGSVSIALQAWQRTDREEA